ncbi:hypothetical protein [Streptomyces flavotricini]|uniref:hypothetical protein n=1 Tax=Streptomyces flavotricini TaxID=66888 RepID=UPI001E3DA6A1|nr:hypothetical protein [Streptomyces flavotricini]
MLREPNPSDRGSSLLALTQEGARLVDAAEKTFTDALTEFTKDALDSASAPAAAHILAKLRSTLQEEQIGTPTG